MELLTYVLIWMSLVIIFFTIFNNIMLNKILRELKQKVQIDQKTDAFIEDVMNYAFELDLSCSIMPNEDGKQTLYHTKEDQIVPICEIFTVANKKGTTEYTAHLKSITDKIDGYQERLIKQLQDK